MKTIGIDARLYSQTGVGTYLQNFIHFLPAHVPENYQINLYVSPEDAPTISLAHPRMTIKITHAKWHTLQEQSLFGVQLMQDKLDLMHFTYFSFPIWYPRAFIATVHDLTPLLFKTGQASTRQPLLYEFKHRIFTWVLSTQIHRAKRLIVPTQVVKDQILAQYPDISGNKIVSIYEGVDWRYHNVHQNETLRKQFHFPYLLYVGNYYPHKNVERLIKAFESVSGDIKLVLRGPDNYFSKRLKQLVHENNLTERVIFYYPHTFEDMAFLYRNAQALVVPSLSEGFGLPIVESLYFGTPVITSDIPVFHELIGKKFHQFDPYNTNSMRIAIEKEISHPTTFLSEELLNGYSFEEMTKKTVKLYKNYLGE
ncbi:glycosyltransferase family 4 protein [Candidatus Roizmanbacteria bacterium]|nr:glycosyltransferase family 4 protein [Candidatus Roizmanbacteria bacterium]